MAKWQRQAVGTLLRDAGLSPALIGHQGKPSSTVARALNLSQMGTPAPDVQGTDGKAYPGCRCKPLVIRAEVKGSPWQFARDCHAMVVKSVIRATDRTHLTRTEWKYIDAKIRTSECQPGMGKSRSSSRIEGRVVTRAWKRATP